MEKSILKTWLDKLQQESWQLELLISGFAIFGLFNFKNYISRAMEVFYVNSHNDISFQMYYGVLVVLLLATNVFIINLLIHVLVRGLWIGAIGLRYVSGEIDYPQLKYNDRFIKYLKRSVGSFDNYIIQLEKISSIIFSFTFLLFFIFISFFLFFLFAVLIDFAFKKIGYDESYLAKIVQRIWVVSAGIVAFDFITLGLIKRIKQRHFSWIYLRLYKVVGIITLSFLWRALLLNFLDQKFTKRMLLGIIPYILLVTVVLPNGQITSYEYFPAIFSSTLKAHNSNLSQVVNANTFNKLFYDSMRNKQDTPQFELIRSVSIPSNKVSGNIFEVFSKHTIFSDKYIVGRDSALIKLGELGYHNSSFGLSEFSILTEDEKYHRIKIFLAQQGEIDESRRIQIKDSLNKVFDEQDSKVYSENLLKIKKYIKEEISFFIDHQEIPDSLVSMDFYIHPNAEEKGMLSFFPIDLSLGRHSFTYQKLVPSKNTSIMDTFKITIPFIYTGK